VVLDGHGDISAIKNALVFYPNPLVKSIQRHWGSKRGLFWQKFEHVLAVRKNFARFFWRGFAQFSEAIQNYRPDIKAELCFGDCDNHGL